LLLDTPGLLSWAEAQCFLSVVDDAYPARLRRWENAPPAMWLSGSVPASEMIGIVGCRAIPPPVRRFAGDCAKEAGRLGFAVVSGGASGCDSAASACASECLLFLPYGLGLYWGGHPALSLCAPDEPFSTGSAMERNALIYASSSQTIVAQSRFREGGTWVGACAALRRRLCPVLVRKDDSREGHRALVALGARPLASPGDLEQALGTPDRQAALL
jgi:predicted Rossmann fold nucleotide-binding protein DprA/Smf involved in DNA uptake